jgi:hypothetical protein
VRERAMQRHSKRATIRFIEITSNPLMETRIHYYPGNVNIILYDRPQYNYKTVTEFYVLELKKPLFPQN